MKYDSIFSPGKKIEDAQFICEILCKNRAEKLKETLPLEFWKISSWATYYKSQLRQVHYYLGIYHPNILIKIIREKRLYSLFAKWIKDEFEREHKKTLSITNSIKDMPENIRITNSTGKKNKDLDLGKFDE